MFVSLKSFEISKQFRKAQRRVNQVLTVTAGRKEECGVRSAECGVRKMQSVENEECRKC